MANPLISIITITYNHEMFIAKCIGSVLAQTYPNWEQIIIDDGSTDNTDGIISQYQDQRIRYHHQENKGILRLAETYNKALNLAKGNLIAILEGDDFWPQDKLERQIPAFDDKNVVLSWGRAGIVNYSGRLITTTKALRINHGMESIYHNNPMGRFLKILLYNNPIPSPTVIVRNENLLAIGGFQYVRGALAVDYPTWLRLTLQGRFMVLNEVLGYWRNYRDQISSRFIIEQAEGRGTAVLKFHELLPESVKRELGMDKNKLLRLCEDHISHAHFTKGRYELAHENWSEARVNLFRAVRNGTFRTKVMAMFGLCASLLKFDLEGIARFFRRPTLD
jgi:glycosyltransferase involved in cell wall biosynthesis